MAKQQKVKLGPKASVFYDPSTGLKLSGEASVLPNARQQRSEKFRVALQNGHLIRVDDEDETETADAGVFNQDKATNAQLIAKILELDEDQDEAALKKLKKPELIDLYDELSSEDDEDEDDEEDEA